MFIDFRVGCTEHDLIPFENCLFDYIEKQYEASASQKSVPNSLKLDPVV